MTNKLTDRNPSNLDWQMLSKRGCERCHAGPGEPHTIECANRRVAEAMSSPTGRAVGFVPEHQCPVCPAKAGEWCAVLAGFPANIGWQHNDRPRSSWEKPE